MKLKIGYKWKSTGGISKGKIFKVVKISPNNVIYKSEETGTIYTTDRKHFEKYIQRVNKYWTDTNKSYKQKKEKLKEN